MKDSMFFYSDEGVDDPESGWRILYVFIVFAHLFFSKFALVKQLLMLNMLMLVASHYPYKKNPWRQRTPTSGFWGFRDPPNHKPARLIQQVMTFVGESL